MTVGITGSIASGKSIIARILNIMGYFVYSADDEAKKLYRIPSVAEKFNRKISRDFIDVKNPDFKKIADFAFASRQNNSLVTGILYPFLFDKIDESISNFPSNKLFFVEAALLFESGLNKKLDKSMCIVADETIRFQRLRLRNKDNYESCLLRTQFQYSCDVKCRLSDYVIVNNDNTAVLPQLMNVLKQLQIINEKR